MSFKLDKPAMFSVNGYKRNSKDVNNKQNIIASGDITMEDVDFPIHGVDNLGNEKIMEPGKDYSFPGDIVLETPLTKKEMPNFDEGTNKFKMGGFPMTYGTKDHKTHLKQQSDFEKAFADARANDQKTFEFEGSDGKTRLYNTAYEGEGTVVDTSSITGKPSIGVQGKGGDQQVLYPSGTYVAPWAREEMSDDALVNVLDIHDVDSGMYEGTQEEMKEKVAEDYSGKNK